MLTGDRQQPAENVKNELGLSECHAELLPAQKLELFKGLKSKSKGACFVGDGINDAPVLSASDCGIAMGFGSEAAIEASDAVLASGTLKQLPKAIKIARSVINTVKGNIIFALSIKALVIILAAFGLAQIWMSVIADTGVSVVCVRKTPQKEILISSTIITVPEQVKLFGNFLVITLIQILFWAAFCFCC